MNKNTDSKGDRFMPVIYLSMIILVVICIIVYCLDIPETLFGLTDKEGKVQPNNVNGEFFQFLFLILGGVVALWGLWINNKRLKTTNKQVELQTEQVKIAIKQIQLAEKTQINTRFKDAAQLLASEHTSAILSGIYALDQIAVEVSKSDDEQYKGYVQVVLDILCAYLRENSVLDYEDKPVDRKRPKIVFQTIVLQLFLVNESVYAGLYKDLQRTYLADLSLNKANLQGAVLIEANLQGAWLCNTNLQSAFLIETNLQRANLQKANLRGALFNNAKFYKTDFSEAEMDESTNLGKTRLAGYSIEEITRPLRSLILTKVPNY